MAAVDGAADGVEIAGGGADVAGCSFWKKRMAALTTSVRPTIRPNLASLGMGPPREGRRQGCESMNEPVLNDHTCAAWVAATVVSQLERKNLTRAPARAGQYAFPLLPLAPML